MNSIDILNSDQDEIKVHTREFVLWKRKWEEYKDSLTLEWKFFQLIDSQKSHIPKESGIYTLIVQPGIAFHPACSYLIYIGQTKCLSRRFGEYLNEAKNKSGRPKITWWLRRYPQHIWFYFSLVEEQHLDNVEDSLLSAYFPPGNDKYPASVRQAVNAF